MSLAKKRLFAQNRGEIKKKARHYDLGGCAGATVAQEDLNAENWNLPAFIFDSGSSLPRGGLCLFYAPFAQMVLPIGPHDVSLLFYRHLPSG